MPFNQNKHKSPVSHSQSFQVTDRQKSKVTDSKRTSQKKKKKKKKLPRYSAERVIGGFGSSGCVYKAVEISTGRTVAIKKRLEDKRYKHRELQILKVLKHPHIVILLDSFHSCSKNQNNIYLCLVFEWIPSTLYSKIIQYAKFGETMPFILIKLYSYQICHALSYIHNKNICHRDLKPENILLNPFTNIIKICDFGSSKRLKYNESSISYVTSRYYRAPELIFESNYYTNSADLWSLGCVFGELFLGTPLFQGDKSIDQLIEIIKVLGTPSQEDINSMNSEYTTTKFPYVQPLSWKVVFCGVEYKKKSVSNNAIDLISRLIVFNPRLRISSFDALTHPFFDELKKPNGLSRIGMLPTLFNFTDIELIAIKNKRKVLINVVKYYVKKIIKKEFILDIYINDIIANYVGNNI